MKKMEKREERVRIRLPWIVKVAVFFSAAASILFKKEWKD